jgi:hypothetical protein
MTTRRSTLLRVLIAGLVLGSLIAIWATRAGSSSNRQAKAMAMLEERCKISGEKIYKPVNDVDGFQLLKVRPSSINFDDQFRLDDPYGRDFGGDAYIQSFLRGTYQTENRDIPKDGPPRLGYLYVEVHNPVDGQRYRYTGRVEEAWQADKSYLRGHMRFVVSKAVSDGPPPRYGVTHDDISTQEEREYWIAGSSLKVIDLRTNEVIAERIGYMVDAAQGRRGGGRSPWLFAADYACPSFLGKYKVRPGSSGPAFPSQLYQTLDFVEKVLKPSSQ